MSKINFGICMVPFGHVADDLGWLQPKPSVKSWQAAMSIGFTDVRLQFQVGGDMSNVEPPVSLRPGDWYVSLFRAYLAPLVVAGMKINLNYCTRPGAPAHQDAAFHAEAAERIVAEFGPMVDSWSAGNEPGPDAQKYEAEHPDGNYMTEVYLPQFFLPFMGTVRRLLPKAWLLGCDADSADIQKAFTDAIDQLGGKDSNVCDEELDHPYYHVNPALDYASMKGANGKPGFLDVKTPNRPIGIGEIDDSDALHPFAFLEAVVHGDFGPITRYYELFQGAEYRFFEPEPGGRYSSFYSPNPVVNENGRRYAELFALANGPVDPLKKTPVRRRAVKK